MGVFEFIIIIVIITTLGKVAMAVGGPMVDKLGDIAGHMASDRKVEAGPGLDDELLGELERRLTRIEDRLDFLEELKAPDERPALGGGLDRGGRTGAVAPDADPAAGTSRTDEPTAGDA